MSDNKIPVKTNSITDDYNVHWNHKLGTGVSGPVRLCTKRGTNENFAVKCLSDTSRSRTEIRIHWLCAGHHNIVDIYQVHANDVQFPRELKPRARLLVVMELMEGGELFDRISKQKCFTEKKAAAYMRQIGECLKRCHSLNVAHRDLKPENLLLKNDREDAEVKLSDFGFAKIDNGQLHTPQFTPYYVAPEVLLAQQHEDMKRLGIAPGLAAYFCYDKSCDMWSAGVILYIMLCGYPPFYSETPSRQITEAMKIKIMTGEYEFPENDWLRISEDAKDVVRRLLHIDPKQRMAVSDLLNHAWLLNAPDTPLHSPTIISNKDEFEDTKMAHSAQLTALRGSDVSIILKPIRQVNNPMMRKRMYRNRSSHSQAVNEEPQPKQVTTEDDRLQSLRDMVTYCAGPQDDAHRQHLNQLTKKAITDVNNDTEFLATLDKWHWDGEKFPAAVDTGDLADSLIHLIQFLSLGDTSKNCVPCSDYSNAHTNAAERNPHNDEHMNDDIHNDVDHYLHNDAHNDRQPSFSKLAGRFDFGAGDATFL